MAEKNVITLKAAVLQRLGVDTSDSMTFDFPMHAQTTEKGKKKNAGSGRINVTGKNGEAFYVTVYAGRGGSAQGDEL